MLELLKETIDKIETLSKNKPIKVISHNDTDGITSAAIFSKALFRWKKTFSLEIVKGLEKEYIQNLSKDNILIFLDLASGSLKELSKKNTEIFILDHHEIPDPNSIPKNITIVNPVLLNKPNISASAICYLFAKPLSQENQDLSNLAVIGMVGDLHDTNLNKTYQEITSEAEVSIKKGLKLYPATRPLDRVLEYSFSMFIPEVTGNFKGVLELLRETGIQKTSKGFKSIAELTDEEMSNLTTSILLRKSGVKQKSSEDMIGNIYLLKFFNRVEDARELSALINACSRMDYPDIALGFCLGNKLMKKEAEKIYTKYKKSISSALEEIQKLEKIQGNDYIIINAKDKIKDTIIGTIASIMSFSPLYTEGTIIVTMALIPNSNKIKVSSRVAGRKGRNVRKILSEATLNLTEEIGGHEKAAGCLLDQKHEKEFIQNLKKILDIELVKV